MNSENTRTSLGKWSVAFALTSIIVVSLLLLWLMIPVWFGHVSGESGLALAGIIGMAIYFASHIICITSVTGIGFAITAIFKTHRRQGLTGLLLNIATLIIAGGYLVALYHKMAIDPARLPIAASRGDYKTVEKLLDKGFDVNYQCGSATALSYAAGQGNEKIVKMLIDRGANVNIANPLSGAAQKGNERIVRLLLEHGADPNCLYNAIYDGHIEIVKILIDHGANVNQKVDNSGRTPLQTAVEWGRDEIIKLLIGKGADVNLCNGQGETPLHVLVQMWPQDSWANDFRTKAINILLDNGADIEAKTPDGKTPLRLAAEAQKSSDAVKVLLERGANPGNIGDVNE